MPASNLDDVGEDLPDAVTRGVEAQSAAHPAGQRAVQTGQDLDGAARSPETGDGLEAGEGQDHLRLVVRVLVVAAGVIQGDAGLVLQGVALGGLGLTGVDLEGQGLLGRDELEEEGQPAPEAPDDVLTQEALRLGVDEL